MPGRNLGDSSSPALNEAEYKGLSSNSFNWSDITTISSLFDTTEYQSGNLDMATKEQVYPFQHGLVHHHEGSSVSSFNQVLSFVHYGKKNMILQSDHKFPLNKRSEMMGKCRHKFLLNRH